jgi:hypothetical protein
MMGVVR